MAKHIFYNTSVVVNGVDLSDHVESVEVTLGINKQNAAAVNELQDYSMAGTQTVSDPKINFYQDYAAAKVYATFMAAWQARTTFNVVVKNDAGARSPTNPEWTIPSFVAEMPMLSGTRGDRHMAAVTCGVAGVMTILTA